MLGLSRVFKLSLGSVLILVGSSSFAAVGAVEAEVSPTSAVESALPANSAPQTTTYQVEQEITTTVDDALLQGFSALTAKLSAGAYVPTMNDAGQALSVAELKEGKLALSFDKATLEELLSAQGVHAWQGLNNPIMVWMTDLSATVPSLISGQQMSPFAKSLNHSADTYQLRLMYPLMDLDDVTQVNPQTIERGEDAVLAAASARYGADYILAATVESAQDVTSVSWTLLDKNGKEISKASLDGVGAEVATLMAGDVARTLAAAPGKIADTEAEPVLPDVTQADAFALGPYQGLVRVRIAGVQSLSDIGAIKRTLIIYGYEDTVQVTALSDGALIMAIPSSSDPAILDGTMARAQDFTKEGPWTYRWLKSSGSHALPGFGQMQARSSSTAASVPPLTLMPETSTLPQL